MVIRLLAAPVALVALTTTAFAHPGHGAEGFAGGFAHPLLGLDHLAALLMVGAWSAMADDRRALAGPAAFLVAIAAGFGLGALGTVLPGTELAIALSLVALGSGLALAWHAPVAAACVGLVGFGLFHGQAHWIEAGTDGAFIAGVLSASALVTAVGYGLGRGIARMPAAVGRAAGAIGAVMGLAAMTTLP